MTSHEIPDGDDLEHSMAPERTGGCKCQDATTTAAEPDEIPSEEELQRLLDDLPVASDGGLTALDLDALDSALELVDDLGSSLDAPEETVAMSDLVALVERYPGLKVTFSY